MRRVFVIIGLILLIVQAGSAVSTELQIQKYAPDGETLLAEKTVDYRWMEENLPVHGDGMVHYYHQGPVFLDDPDERWNPAEDKNVREKDMGAVMGTDLRDLCDLAGGMNFGDIVEIRASDGFVKKFAYQNVYEPLPRQGRMVIAWYRADEGYVPDYATGMRLIFFADTTTNPWGIHAFGNWDWHESADEEYWYYYVQGGERYPTTTGLSVQTVSEIVIYQGGGIQQETSSPLGLGYLLPVIAVIAIGLAVFRRISQ